MPARCAHTKLMYVSETTTPDPGFIDQLSTVYLQNGTLLKPVIRRLLDSPQFQDPAVLFTRYSWPAEFVVRSLKETGWVGFSLGSALSPLVSLIVPESRRSSRATRRSSLTVPATVVRKVEE